MKNAWKLMGLTFSFLALLSACGSSDGDDNNPPPVSTGKWTWASGSHTVNQAGIYGTQGIAAPSNVPGARLGAVSWIDSGGKLWLFGGRGYDSAGSLRSLNDLWKYDPATLDWTWVAGSTTGDQAGIYGTKGTADPANVPGARSGAVSWVDSGGKLWLFGGSGTADYFSCINDLWAYDPTTNEWTWVSGSDSIGQVGIYGTKGTADPSNVPGARSGAVSWIDSGGKLWLFGGAFMRGAGHFVWLNDLWKYNPATLEWTWVSGNNTENQGGVYGTQGTAASTNVPGGRTNSVSWIDSSGKLWLFGGWGFSQSSASDGLLNDLWKYDPATLEWTWLSGSYIENQVGIYGTLGTAASTNVPGGRTNSVSWIDSGGKLWLFGGSYHVEAGNVSYINDLWKCDPATLEWTWLSGSYIENQAGIYGTLGTAASTNVPGGRLYAISWIDSSSELWLFGGRGYDSDGQLGSLNDLWRYSR